mmetsp:Transcript_22871/g.68743  ORF Transcript_22871/g.68743 Transcript_22871/m.68743 type:complete len:299 (-) Transcript_22871:621-1517(-)
MPTNPTHEQDKLTCMATCKPNFPDTTPGTRTPRAKPKMWVIIIENEDAAARSSRGTDSRFISLTDGKMAPPKKSSTQTAATTDTKRALPVPGRGSMHPPQTPATAAQSPQTHAARQIFATCCGEPRPPKRSVMALPTTTPRIGAEADTPLNTAVTSALSRAKAVVKYSVIQYWMAVTTKYRLASTTSVATYSGSRSRRRAAHGAPPSPPNVETAETTDGRLWSRGEPATAAGLLASSTLAPAADAPPAVGASPPGGSPADGCAVRVSYLLLSTNQSKALMPTRTEAWPRKPHWKYTPP